MWQDWVIAGIQLMLILSLLPTVFHPTHKPALWTGILMTGCIAGFAVIYFTLEFWFAVLMSSLLASLWAVIAFQRYRLNKKSA